MPVIHTTATAPRTPTAPPPDAVPSWRQIVAPVQPFLRAVARRLAEQVEAFEPEIREHVRYALGSQGKQLRPALVGLSAEAAGRVHEDHVTVATIIEMVHLATLVHDDVMDAAALRRRRPTLAVQCGPATSVLVGDCLFAHALVLAAGFPTPDVCRAVAAATRTVCTGETIQTERPGRLDQGREAYYRILRMKTGELFALSCELGAQLAGAEPDVQFALRTYGMELGTAYQIYDDCVDLFGSESQAGKSLGTDLLSGKLTLPLLVAGERTRGRRREELEALLRAWEPRHLVRLHAWLRETDALSECQRVIAEYCQRAAAALRPLPANTGRLSLSAAAEFLARQADTLGAGAEA